MKTAIAAFSLSILMTVQGLALQPTVRKDVTPKPIEVIVEPAIGDLVLVTHATFVTGTTPQGVSNEPLSTQSVGWVVSLEPRVTLAQRRWEGEEGVRWYSVVTMSPDLVEEIEVIQ